MAVKLNLGSEIGREDWILLYDCFDIEIHARMSDTLIS